MAKSDCGFGRVSLKLVIAFPCLLYKSDEIQLVSMLRLHLLSSVCCAYQSRYSLFWSFCMRTMLYHPGCLWNRYPDPQEYPRTVSSASTIVSSNLKTFVVRPSPRSERKCLPWDPKEAEDSFPLFQRQLLKGCIGIFRSLPGNRCGKSPKSQRSYRISCFRLLSRIWKISE